jgi:ParB family chromosome partitioning protein
MFIVTETNLIQRSFADMLHSERSVVIAIHYESVKKKQGYRSDLLGIDDDTLCPVGTKSTTKDKVAEQYGLSQSTIMRYLRVNKLIQPLKARLDKGEIAMRVAVTLSYLREKEQELVESQLADGGKLSIKIANTLRESSEKHELNKGMVKRLFEPSYYGTKVKPIKFSGEFLSQYFDEKQSPELIQGIVEEALKKYFADK